MAGPLVATDTLLGSDIRVSIHVTRWIHWRLAVSPLNSLSSIATQVGVDLIMLPSGDNFYRRATSKANPLKGDSAAPDKGPLVTDVASSFICLGKTFKMLVAAAARANQAHTARSSHQKP
jgi:hypothetical protein